MLLRLRFPHQYLLRPVIEIRNHHEDTVHKLYHRALRDSSAQSFGPSACGIHGV